MAFSRPLRGGCHCGRNFYIINPPQETTEIAKIFFTDSAAYSMGQGPVAGFIRVPLTWVHSSTRAFGQDETHGSIRRVYEPPSHKSAKRQFCGYCGTALSYWDEGTREEAEYIHMVLGSLCREDQEDLEEMGLLPEAAPDDDEGHTDVDKAVAGQQTNKAIWLDDLLAGSRLGNNLRTSKGTYASEDGRVQVEWEITEWADGDSDIAVLGKRKSDAEDEAAPAQKMDRK